MFLISPSVPFIFFIVGTWTALALPTKRFFSCKDLKALNEEYESGTYTIMTPSGEHQVYCEMGINDGGYTFIPNHLISKLKGDDIKYLSNNTNDVLLRIARPDGTQPYTVITPVMDGGKFLISASKSIGALVNGHLGPYLFLSTVPGSQQADDIKAFKTNGKVISYTPCTPGLQVGTIHFAFYSNPHERKMSEYGIKAWETEGPCVDWRKSAQRPYSGRRLPAEYFLFTELHYGACGCYTSSERWMTSVSPALGTAVGLR